MKLLLVAITTLMTLTACSDVLKDGSADISFTFSNFTQDRFGNPEVDITLSHNGGDSIYTASCDIQLTKGSVIVETDFAYFADGGNIDAGQKSIETIKFNKISTHDDYDQITKSDCKWLYSQ